MIYHENVIKIKNYQTYDFRVYKNHLNVYKSKIRVYTIISLLRVFDTASTDDD